jgi:hypothetical protein
LHHLEPWQYEDFHIESKDTYGGEMSKLFHMLMLLVVPAVASAADWRVFHTTRAVEVAIDADSILKSGKITKAWFKSNSLEPERLKSDPSKTFLSAKFQYQFDCREKTYALQTFTYYGQANGEGEVVHSGHPRSTNFAEVIPESVAEGMFNHACKLKPLPKART